MTYQLSRLRLASVGDRAARFTDLTLNMSSLERADAIEPVDSILWLRNGGGKSSLLSLFFALLLPLRRDFMGRSVKRHLEDYVASGDTSHTVAEWVAQSDGSLMPQTSAHHGRGVRVDGPAQARRPRSRSRQAPGLVLHVLRGTGRTRPSPPARARRDGPGEADA